MQIIICGAGVVGTGIARQLAAEGNDVTVIDQSTELIRNLSDAHEVKAIVGFGSHPNVLEEANASEADMIIAVTRSDEVNMVACQIAHSIFNVPMKIARIRNEHYLHPLWHDLYRRDHLPIDVIISPEVEVAHAIHRRLHVPGALDTAPFADGHLRMVAVRVEENCPLLGMDIEAIDHAASGLAMRVVGLARRNRFLLPADFGALHGQDEVYFIAAAEDVRASVLLFGHEEKEAHRILILGGGNIGMYLAEMLEQEDEGVRCKVIEKDPERATYVAERLKRSTVICGSAMDRDILEEADVTRTETLIAVTNDDKVNILASLLAKRQGCQRALVLVNNPGYSGLVSDLGVDAVLNPRETTISTILKHVRRGRILNIYSLRDGLAEIMEAQVMETSRVAGKALEETELPKGVVLAAIVRNNEVIIPKQDTVLQPNDHVVMLSAAGSIKKVEKYFCVQLEYF